MMKYAEREILLKKRLAELKAYEEQLHAKGYTYIAGIDEVGRGPLAGPVVAAAVVLPKDFSVLGIDDSKKVSEKKREVLYGEIIENSLSYGIGIEDNTVIDQINILEATKSAMAKAVLEAEKMLREKVGNGIDYLLLDAVKLNSIETPQESLIKGDERCLSIGAASIVAKVFRDRMMVRYNEQYPGYFFDKNKGYGTKMHYTGLKSNGISPIHRRTFLKNLDEK